MSEPIRFAVVGSGWRSLFYHRIAQACPQQFTMTAMLCRTEEKAQRLRAAHGVPAVTTEEEFLKGEPEWIVVAVNKASIAAVTLEWANRGYPVLCETPAAMTLPDLHALWAAACGGARIQVAEQYFAYPSWSAAIQTARRGFLGDPYAVELSAAHDYHAVSLIRRLLEVGFENARIFGKNYTFPVQETDSRGGPVTDGSVQPRPRARLTFEFESGKTAFYDFSGVQYHSFIRSRHLRLQGQDGELDDTTLRWVDAAHTPHTARLVHDPAYRTVTLEETGELLYRNPIPAALSQDETAIATLMLGMREFAQGGREVYPLAEALQDAYFRILMEQALTTGQPVESRAQPWKT